MFRAKTLLAASAAAALLAAPALAAEIVPLAHFTGVGLRGGGHVTLRYGTEQRVTLLKGSTQFTRLKVEGGGGGLNIDTCNSRCPEHYDLDVEIVSPDVSALAIEGGGDIMVASGFPARRSISLAVSGGGDINARAMNAADVNAAVNGGGDIKVAATGTLNAAVSGGGDIVYWGNPAVSQMVSGGGSIHRAEK